MDAGLSLARPIEELTKSKWNYWDGMKKLYSVRPFKLRPHTLEHPYRKDSAFEIASRSPDGWKDRGKPLPSENAERSAISVPLALLLDSSRFLVVSNA